MNRTLQDFAAFLRAHLDDVAAEQHQVARLALPTPERPATPDELRRLRLTHAAAAELLNELARPASERRPLALGIAEARNGMSLRDALVVCGVRKQVLASFLPRFTSDVTEAVSISAQLDAFFLAAQSSAAEAHATPTPASTEAALRELADAMPQIVWTSAPDGHLDYYNQRWFDYTGMTLEQTKGWGWQPVLHPDDLQACIDRWTRAFTSGEPYWTEYRFKRASDGEYRWHLGRALPVVDGEGRVVKWYGTCTDIHELKAAEDALARANQRLSAQAEALLANNEELSAQAEELKAQQEELNKLYEAVRRHAEEIEAEVARRTEDLRALNEELQAQQAELLRANEQLAAERRFGNELIESLPAALFYLDRDRVYRRVNAAAAAQYGWRPEDMTDRRHAELFPGTEDVIAPLHRRVLDEGETVTFVAYPFTFEAPDGPRTTFWDFTLRPMRGVGEMIVGLLCTGFEVSKRVEDERAAQEQRRLLERIIQQAPAAIAYVDKQLFYRWANPAFLNWMGFTAEQMLDRHVFDVLPGTEDQLKPILDAVLETGEPVSATAYPFTYLGPDGSTRLTHWDYTDLALLDDGGRPEGILILATEVSERVRQSHTLADLVEELRIADRTKDEFLSVISHELRTPLNFIIGFASILEDEIQGPLNEPQHLSIGKILAGADRMLTLVNDLLDFARMSAGKFQLSPQPTAVAPLVAEAAAAMRPLAEQRELKLVTEVGESFQARLDPQRVTQVLTNLLSNAIKFTEPGGEIRVRARRVGSMFTCEVSDTGCGIAPADLDKLFKRFAQLDMSATRSVGGTGLGLSITRALIEAHGGTIGVESTPGVGSTFSFSLPLAGPVATPGPESDSPAHGGHL